MDIETVVDEEVNPDDLKVPLISKFLLTNFISIFNFLSFSS